MEKQDVLQKAGLHAPFTVHEGGVIRNSFGVEVLWCKHDYRAIIVCRTLNKAFRVQVA